MPGEYAEEQHEIVTMWSSGELGPLIEGVSQDLCWKVKESRDSIWIIEKGSNLRLRLLGAWLPGGRANIAIGLTITIEPNDNGQRIQIEAHDRLGWWLDRYLESDTPLKRLVRDVLSQQVGRYVRRLQEELA